MSKNIIIGGKEYDGVKYISCACAEEEGVQRKFIDVDEAGTPTQTKTVDLNMANGDQTVNADSGKAMTAVTVKKPTTLIPANIKNGVSIGGVAGSLAPQKTEQAKTVTITENKTTEVTPDSGNALSKVTVVTNVLPNLQKKTVTPTSAAATVKPDSAYDGLSEVVVNAVPTETKTVTPTKSAQTVTPTSGKFFLQVTVNPIPSEYIVPSGSQEISANGTYDVTSKESVVVNVPATPTQEKTATVTANGTTTVSPDSGKVLSKVTITTNVPATPTEEKTVDLAMASGSQVITPTSGKNISKVTVTKPATLIPANIKKDVNIGGVVGTMEAGGGSRNILPKVADRSVTEVLEWDLAGATYIKPYFFQSCSSLISITIPDSVTAIQESAFNNCSSLPSITIPDSVTVIGESVFQNCDNLIDVTIGNGVVFIDMNALRIGSSKNKAVITMKPTTPPQIESSTFNKNWIDTIFVPIGTEEAYKAATNWAELADYIFEN